MVFNPNTLTLKDHEYVSIDVETTGLSWYDKRESMFGIAIATKHNEYYFDIRHQPEALKWLKRQRPNKVVNHNMKFDLHWLHRYGVNIAPEICRCTQLRASLLDETLMQYSLDALAKLYLKKKKDSDIYTELAELFGGAPTRKVQIKNLHLAPLAMASKYAKIDARIAYDLYTYQDREIDLQGINKVITFEERLWPVIYEMENKGIRIDVDKAKQAVPELEKTIDKLTKNVYKQTHDGFNCNSPLEMLDFFKPQNKNGEWFIDDVKILQTKKGSPSFSRASLELLVNNPLVNDIISLKKMTKTLKVFLKGHILDSVYGGYLYPSVNQNKRSDDAGSTKGTITGRLSYSEPPLQQIPSRDTSIAKLLRPLFIAEDEHVWLCIDYSQFEFRVFAHYVNDDETIAAYLENPNLDYHTLVSKLTGLPRNATKAGGANAKTLNLAMMYDMQEKSISESLGLPTKKITVVKKGQTKEIIVAGEEAKNIIDTYHEHVKGVKELRESVIKTAKKRGYIRTLIGRRIRYPDKKTTYKAKAHLCQGSSADCMKLKLLQLANLFKRPYFKGFRIYLSVHDEFNIGVPKNHPSIKSAIRIIKNILNDFGDSSEITLRVPITCDSGLGYNWGSASGKG